MTTQKKPPIKVGDVPITLRSMALAFSVVVALLTLLGTIERRFILPTVLRAASEQAAEMDVAAIRQHRSHPHDGAVTQQQFNEFVKGRDQIHRTIEERLSRIEIKVDSLLAKRPR